MQIYHKIFIPTFSCHRRILLTLRRLSMHPLIRHLVSQPPPDHSPGQGLQPVHRVHLAVPLVQAEHELVNVQGDVLLTERMVDAVEPALEDGPYALYAVCVAMPSTNCLAEWQMDLWSYTASRPTYEAYSSVQTVEPAATLRSTSLCSVSLSVLSTTFATTLPSLSLMPSRRPSQLYHDRPSTGLTKCYVFRARHPVAHSNSK